MQDKGKRKVSHNPGGKGSQKMKVDPAVMKVTLPIEETRKQRM